MSGNLPAWSGAAECYSRAYRLLECMAARGHATPATVNHRCRVVASGHASADMRDLVDALNRGDEESIKSAILYGKEKYGIPLTEYL